MQLPKKLSNAHLIIDVTKKDLQDILESYLSKEDAEKIVNPASKSKAFNPQIIRACVSRINSSQHEKPKLVAIPSIKPYTANGFTIEDLSQSDYYKVAPIMGFIVNCCAYSGGSGSMLCEAAEKSPYFKIMTINDTNGHIVGLTLVCEGIDQYNNKHLVILGLESRIGANANFEPLLKNAARQMLENNEEYKSIRLTACGKTLYHLDKCTEQKCGNAMSTMQYETVKSFIENTSGLKAIPTDENDLVITDGARFGFETLQKIPETHFSTELCGRWRSTDLPKRLDMLGIDYEREKPSIKRPIQPIRSAIKHTSLQKQSAKAALSH